MECADKSKPAPALDLPNELWVEIFKNVASGHLLELSLVCKHFNRLIFAHLSHRFQFQLSMELYKHGYFLVPERTYKHLTLRAAWLYFPDELLETAQLLVPYVESLKLKLWMLDYKAIMQLLKLCTRLNKLTIVASQFQCGETLDDPNIVVLPAVTCLVLDVLTLNNVEKFLPSIPNVRDLEIGLSLEAASIPKVFAAMSNGLPHVETLHLSGERAIPLNELAQMKCLKEVTMNSVELLRYDEIPVPLPQVETFTSTMLYWHDIGIVLNRFPNLKNLSLLMYVIYDLRSLQAIVSAAHCLKHLVIHTSRLTPNKIEVLQQLTKLQKLTISTSTIAKTNFSLLRKLMVLPELRILQIDTESFVPVNISTTVAAANRNCKLTLNGEQVFPAAFVARRSRTGVKRKYPKQK